MDPGTGDVGLEHGGLLQHAVPGVNALRPLETDDDVRAAVFLDLAVHERLSRCISSRRRQGARAPRRACARFRAARAAGAADPSTGRARPGCRRGACSAPRRAWGARTAGALRRPGALYVPIRAIPLLRLSWGFLLDRRSTLARCGRCFILP